MTNFNSIRQEVITSTLNSHYSNVNAGVTWEGSGESTTGVNSIQVTLKADQNCTIYIDQSPDNVNLDSTDTYNYITTRENNYAPAKATLAYVRVRVKNTSTVNTTYFSLSTFLCPIDEPLPRSLDANGNLKVGVKSTEDLYGFEVENTPMGEMRVITPIKLVGAQFDGTTVDPNFWTVTNANGGTTTQANAQITLLTNTTANGSTKLVSVKRARYTAGSSQAFRAIIQMDAGASDNTRKWGVAWGASLPTITDGAYFQLSGTTFSIVTLKGSSPATVSSGSFNGTLGATYTPTTSATTYEIYWTNSKVYFVVGDQILHTVSASSTTWANTVNHHIYLENTNTNSSVTNVTMNCRTASIRRLGPVATEQRSKFQTGVTGSVYKYGPGLVKGIVVGAVPNSGAVITLYDNTAASGTILDTFTFSFPGGGNFSPVSISLFDKPFSIGLYVNTTVQSASLSVSYE